MQLASSIFHSSNDNRGSLDTHVGIRQRGTSVQSSPVVVGQQVIHDDQH